MTGPVATPAADPVARPDSTLAPVGRDWPESNCYVDLWIELLEGVGLIPEACLSFTLASDFEGDQWTFFKPPHSDLFSLYGIAVEELTIWRTPVDHFVEQVRRRRIPLVEVDAYYLPDTQGLDYHVAHGKTTIAIQQIDPDRRHLEYLHNRGRHRLEGADFESLFELPPPGSSRRLAPYCEFAKLDRMQNRDPGALAGISLELAREHFARRPAVNPIEAYARQSHRHLESLVEDRGESFDRYAFATIRQCGSGYAFTSDYLRWLGRQGFDATTAPEYFDQISSCASRIIMKMARVAHSGRIRDLGGDFAAMAEAWSRGFEALERGLFR